MRRLLLVVTCAGLLVAVSAGPALATHCTVVHKPIGAGSKVLIDTTTDSVTFTGPGQGKGGFASLDFNGDGTADADVFMLPVTPALHDDLGVGFGSLPDGAHNAGPGNNECDGIGIDDLFAC